jgi:hypothetical protein
VNTRMAVFVSLGLLGAAMLACEVSTASPTGTPPVVQMMPNLPGYRVVEGKTLQEYIATLSEGAALLSGNPEMAFLIEKVDRAADCYQDTGALNMRIFTDEGFPLSSGVIAIADQNRLTDPSTLLNCVGGELMPFSTQQARLDVCSNRYTLDRDDNSFHVIYVGTTQEICQAFCASLEGCIEQ